MRTFVIFFFAFLAMAAAQGVHVVEDSFDNNPNTVHVVETSFDNNPSNGVDSAYYLPHGDNGVNIVNPDPAFSQPHGGYEQPDISPAYVQGSRPPYPYKQYDNPLARGGR